MDENIREQHARALVAVLTEQRNGAMNHVADLTVHVRFLEAEVSRLEALAAKKEDPPK